MTKLYCTAISVWKARFPFRMAFSHNLASRREAETLLVKVVTSTGSAGYGQVLPRNYLTGETLDGALHDIRSLWWPRLREMRLTAGSRNELLERLAPCHAQADASGRIAAWAGIDVAAAGAVSGYGDGSKEALPLVGVVPTLSPGKAAWLARVFRWLGFERFKVKVGRDAAADSARVAAVRRVVGSRWLAVDANAAWGWDEAVERMAELAGLGVALVEEPLRPDCAATADFRRLEAEAAVAIMADESLCTLKNGAELLARGSPSWWNLRLAKNGGFSGVSRLARLARDNGVRVYGGILVGETGAMATASRAAFAMAGAECGEYGFPRVFLRDDPFRGSPAGYFGRFAPAVGHGRVVVRAAALARRGELVFSERA